MDKEKIINEIKFGKISAKDLSMEELESISGGSFSSPFDSDFQTERIIWKPKVGDLIMDKSRRLLGEVSDVYSDLVGYYYQLPKTDANKRYRPIYSVLPYTGTDNPFR